MGMGFDVSCKSIARLMKTASEELATKLQDCDKEEKIILVDQWLEDCDLAIIHLRKCDPCPSNWGKHGQPYTSEEIDSFIIKMEEGLDILTQGLMSSLE